MSRIGGASIITTSFNEEETIGPLINRLRITLASFQHEIIVVDDDSDDATFRIAARDADLAVRTRREGQSACLLRGLKLARFQLVVTIDADLENPPELIPKLLDEAQHYDILVASRSRLPRVSEIAASRTLGRALGVSDVFSNFRVYRREDYLNERIRLGETFGAELLLIGRSKGLKIGEYLYDPPPRRDDPRIGGRFRANMRIMWALMKCTVKL